MSPATEFDGKSALVTGAASGIGRATTARLLGLGATVIAFDADTGGLEGARGGWPRAESAVVVPGNVASSDDVRIAFEALQAARLPLAALVNCAGIHSQALVEDLSDDEWRRVIRVNLRGTFLCCREAARLMVPQGSGAIVNMSSGLAYSGARARAHYAASKGAVAAFTKSLALELAPRGVRANAIAPGAMDTPMPRNLPGRTEEQVLANLKRNPLQRVGTAEDVADLILFLVSSNSAHITGQVMHINGGGLMP